MDKAPIVCALRMSCASAVPTLHGPTWAGAFPPSAHLPWISPFQLRRQWFHLSLTVPRTSGSFVEIKARRSFAGTLWLKSYALITVLGVKHMASVLGCTDDA